jgi:protein-arginine deiminase
MAFLTRACRPKTSHQLFLSACRIASYFSLKADIRADTNRDGFVDVTGDSDISVKSTWSRDRGAIFLANIGDTQRRCSRALLDSNKKPSNEELAACHDASDNIQRAPQYMAPLRTVPLKDIPHSTKGYISIPNTTQRGFVRIFRLRAKEWTFVEQGASFSAAELKEGLVLEIDARDTRRPGGWDGRVIIRFTVGDGVESSSDEVMLRVAPVVVHHHLERVQQVMAVKDKKSLQTSQMAFLEDLNSVVQDAGISKPLHLFEGDDRWAQDIVEPGYTSMPGPNGPISLRIMVRTGQDDRDAGRQCVHPPKRYGCGCCTAAWRRI